MLDPREPSVKFDNAPELRREVPRDPRVDFIADAGAKRSDWASSLSSSSSSSPSLIGSMAGKGSSNPSGTADSTGARGCGLKDSRRRTQRSYGDCTSSLIRLPVEERLVPVVGASCSTGGDALGAACSTGGEFGASAKSGLSFNAIGDFDGVPSGCTFRVTSPRGFRPES